MSGPLLARLLLRAGRVAERLVLLAGDQEVVEQHRQLPRHRDDRSPLGFLLPSRRYLLAMATEVSVRAKRTQDVVGAGHQEAPQEPIAGLGDPQLGLVLSRVVL